MQTGIRSLSENPQQNPLIEVRGVSIRTGGREILSNIDMIVHSGEVLTLIGPNGAGKTTLIRAILGLEKPSAGTIKIRDGIRIGYMPQQLAIDPTLPLPVSRFLKLAGKMSDGNCRRALDEVSAGHTWDTAIGDVSGGEFQRVLLARALLRDPDLLVLDEPVQAVDVNGQTQLYELIGGLKKARGCGVLMVSHDLHLVMSATDQVVCINGHLCCSGHPEMVSRDPSYIALFGDSVAANMALYQHRHDHHHDLDGSVIGGVEGAPHNHG
ncbi:MAG: zinc ABC transporter ATP-binding protein ZnuC [Rhodospirillales bacterium]|nr:zinc ABC transporter ATP-binding protein ZnuC [Rhodospirillales bacterium]